MAISLIIILGFLSFSPRAIRQHIPGLGITEFRSYAVLDKTKNRVGRVNLYDYYRVTGDSAKAQLEFINLTEDYPENRVVTKVDSLAILGLTYEAINFGKELIAINPMFASSYFAVATEYLVLRNIDSAISYFEIAYAMNPDNRDILFGLATAHAHAGNDNIAKRHYKRAIELGLDSIDVNLILNYYPDLKR